MSSNIPAKSTTEQLSKYGPDAQQKYLELNANIVELLKSCYNTRSGKNPKAARILEETLNPIANNALMQTIDTDLAQPARKIETSDSELESMTDEEIVNSVDALEGESVDKSLFKSIILSVIKPIREGKISDPNLYDYFNEIINRLRSMIEDNVITANEGVELRSIKDQLLSQGLPVGSLKRLEGAIKSR